MASVHDQIVTNQNLNTVTKATQDAASGVKQSSSSVSSQDFLYLLTQQLQYQDPMDPMDNSEMLAQEAQFSTLEQMENLASSFSTFSSVYQANSLLGRTVEVSVDGKTTKGTVDYVDYSDSSGASVHIGEKNYPLSSVTKVYPDDTTASKEEEEHKNFVSAALDNIAGNLGYLAKKAYEMFEGTTDTDTTTDTTDTNIDKEGQ